MEKELIKGRYITPKHVEAYQTGVYKTLKFYLIFSNSCL